MRAMKITDFGVAVVEGDTHLSKWVEDTKRLDCEDFCRRVCEQHLKPGDVVVDGGACIGDHTLAYLNAVGISGRVISFEPNPEAFRCLIQNCPQAQCLPMGLGFQESKMIISQNENLGAAFLSDGSDGEQVMVIPLDDLKLDRLNLLKLDLEGMELDALRGSVGTMAHCHPIILVELNNFTLIRRGTNRGELIEFLEKMGYRMDSKGRTDLDDPHVDVLFFYHGN